MPKLYTQEDFDNAIAAIRCGLSYRKASLQFGVPKSTLTDRIAGGKHKRQEQVFTPQEEEGFVEYFSKLSQRECGVNSLEVRNTIKCWLDRDQRKVLRFKDNMPTSNWVTQFKKRHPMLNIKPLKTAKPIKIKYEVPEEKYVEIVKVSPDSTQESLVERNVPSTTTCHESLIDHTIPSTIVDRSIPSSAMDRTIPSSTMDRTILSSAMDRSIHSSAMEQSIPSSPMDQTIPSSAMDRNIPSSAMEHTIPMSAIDRIIPPLVINHAIPSSSVEQNIPSSAMERTILSSVVDQTSSPLVVNPTIASSAVERTIPPSVVNRTIQSTTQSINTRTFQSGTSSIKSGNSKIGETPSEVLPIHSKNYIALKALEATLSEQEQNVFHRRFQESHSLEVDVMYIAWKVLKHRCANESPTMVNDYLRSEKRISYSQKSTEVIPNPVAEETMIQLQEIINKYQEVDVEKKPSVIVAKSDINNV